MRESWRVGLSFGLTSGVITTMGLMVGLYTGTQSLQAVIGGVLMIAIADAFSDALGMHVHEESEQEHTAQEIWESTLATFLSKFVFSLTFIVPILIFDLKTAVVVSVIWGLSLEGLLSYQMAKRQGEPPWKVIAEHVSIALCVVIATGVVGQLVHTYVHS